MDIQLEQKDNKISFPENKIGIADDKVVDEMNKISDKEKHDRVMKRLGETLDKHKYKKN